MIKMIKSLMVFIVGILLLVVSVSAADKYVTPTGAGLHNGQIGNEWTLKEASQNAIAGDVVHIKKGQYNINGTNALDKINFANDGTKNNPIIFVGEFDAGYVPETADGTKTSYIYSTYTVTNAITISGDYVILRKLNMAQGPGVTKTLIDVSGDNVIIEDCIVKYLQLTPGEHTTTVGPSAQNFTLRNSFMYYGGRTIIWGESSNTEGVDGIIIEGNTFVQNNNHNAIQIMPLTGMDPGYKITGAIIRNNLFRDCTYSNNILLRHNNNAQIYNNVFLNSGYIKLESHNYGDNETENITIAYNTFIDDGLYPLFNQAMHGVNWKNNLFLSTTTLDNYIYRFWCTGSVPPIRRTSFDYNLNYADGDPNLNAATIPWYTNSNDCGSAKSISWDTWKTTYGQDTHSIVGQRPQFVNEAERDFRPASATAPQVGKGIPIAGITTDKNGNSRSLNTPTIGAYEYVDGTIIYHPADINQDDCISLGEISTYVGRWLSGTGVTLSQASSAVSTWMGGC